MWGGGMLGLGLAAGTAVFIIIVVWSLFWKGLALWNAAKNHQIAWFIALLLLNTAGILEIVYLLAFRKDRETRKFADLFAFARKAPAV